MKKISLFILLAIFAFSSVFAQKSKKNPEKTAFKWYTFEEAMALNKKHPRKIFIDVYTDWCGWCVRMDNTTFSDSIIKNYLKDHYYPVKLNAERKDPVVYLKTTYVNPNPDKPRSTHQLASTLLKGQLAYPSYVILNEKLEIINNIKGYKSSKDLEVILHYFGSNANIDQTWPDYSKSFKSSYE